VADITNAAGGFVVCLSAGTYPAHEWIGLHKTRLVTIQPSPGATVRLGQVTLTGAHNLTFAAFSSLNGRSSSGGLLLRGQLNGDPDTNIIWEFNSMPSNGVTIDTNPTSNANIIIANNKFVGYATSTEQSRVLVNAQNDPMCPDGTTISFNLFAGGRSDGTDIDGGSCGTSIQHNIYTGILQDRCGAIHCDSVQDNGGGEGTTVNGNYFFDTTIGLRFDDGSDADIVTNNVFATPQMRCFEGQYGSSSRFSHNTFDCVLNLGQDHGGDKSNNVTMTDNVFAPGATLTYFPDCSTWGTFSKLDFNVQDSASDVYGCGFADGTHDKVGNPTFVGGAQPRTWAGWELTPDSLGHRAASDGKDMGADIGVVPGPSW
jgi:hypothetical protein